MKEPTNWNPWVTLQNRLSIYSIVILGGGFLRLGFGLLFDFNGFAVLTGTVTARLAIIRAVKTGTFEHNTNLADKLLCATFAYGASNLGILAYMMLALEHVIAFAALIIKLRHYFLRLLAILKPHPSPETANRIF